MESVVVRDPEIMAGEPTFRGTRVLVRTLFDYLEAGRSREFFLEGYPTVGRELAKRALEEVALIPNAVEALERAVPGQIVRVGR